ncbi:hypothetical protein GCM10027073_46290 [Streptomyces chlorus]
MTFLVDTYDTDKGAVSRPACCGTWVLRSARRYGWTAEISEPRRYGHAPFRFATDLAGLPSAARPIRKPLALRTMTSGRLAALTGEIRRRIEDEVLASAAEPAGP